MQNSMALFPNQIKVIYVILITIIKAYLVSISIVL